MKSQAAKLTIFILVSILVTSCVRDGYVAISGYAQGGTYTVKVNMDGVKKSPEALKHGIDSILNVIDTTLSGYNKKSQLSRFNAGEKIDPSDMFKEMYAISRQYWKETGGALDVAAGPLFDVWGFGFTSDSLPSASKVDSVRAICGLDKMPENLSEACGQGFKLNFNAIAQGYSSDKVAAYLYAQGAKDMLVDIGEIFCDGVNPAGRGWSIGVDRPVDGNNTPGEDMDGIWSSDGGAHGLVTSGNYRKFYVRDGKKYAHTIDPRNGYPVSHNLLSATILAPTSTAADAYATYCMVIGLDEAKAFVESRPDLEAYFIYDNDGEMLSWASEGFAITQTD